LEEVNDFIDESAKDGTLLKAFRRWTAIGN